MKPLAEAPLLSDRIKRGESSPDAWYVTVETETGLDKSNISYQIFETKEEAYKYLEAHKVGSILNNKFKDFDIIEYQRINGNYGLFLVHNDEFFPHCYNVLVDAGVKDKWYNTNKDIVCTLTEERMNEFLEQYGENWHCALELEYVICNFPKYSLPYYAAMVFFHYFITYHDYSCAYYWREMKLVLSQAEKLALRSKNRSEKAGKTGGQRSSQKRERRIVHLLDHMQRLLDENPAFARLQMKAVAELAIEDAAKENSSLWSQGKGRVTEYLDEMQADHRYRDKYMALMGKSAQAFRSPPRTA